MDLRDLRCKSCGAPLAERDIDLRLAIARCGHCNVVMSIGAPHTTGGSAPTTTTRPSIRPKVGLPERFQIEDLGSTLTISRSWFHPMNFFLLFFSIAWNGFMVFWHVMAFQSGFLIMSLFGLLHTAVGIGLIYGVAAGFLNKTNVSVGRGMLEIKHGPIPWKGNIAIQVADIEQLFVLEKVRHSENSTHSAYELHAVMRSGERQLVTRKVENADQALYLEQEIERFLKIEDRPVDGEHK